MSVLWEWFCCYEGRTLGVDFHWGLETVFNINDVLR